MQLKKSFILVTLYMTLISCATITVEFKPIPEYATTFTAYNHYWLFGLMGPNNISLKNSCTNGSVVQIQHYYSFEDFLLAFTTLGIYTPKNTKIWCVPKKKFIQDKMYDDI